MAVVGEAHIIVRAITTQVKDDIKRGFSGVDDVINDAGKSIQRTFRNDFAREAEGARRAWQRLQKTGFVLQTAIGSIVAAASSLVLSLGSLVGAVGGAAASFASLSGIIAALPLGLITSRLALGGVAQAVQAATRAGNGYGRSLREINEELQQLKFDQEEAALSVERAGINLERARENLLRVQDLPVASRARREAELEAREADLALRRAIDRRKDLEEELQNPNRRNRGGGGEDPYAGLLPSQKVFAKFIVSLQDDFKKLKAAAANSFLPVLQQQITRLITNSSGVGSFFSVIERGLEIIGGALGQSVTKFFDALTSPSNLGKLSKVFDNAGVTIEKFGGILGSVYDSFLTITTASNASTQRFLDFLSNRAGRFAEFLDTKAATGELETFFNRAASLMSELSKIFSNVFNFIGDLIEDNFSPTGVSGGAYLLSWLREATASWRNLQETVGESEFNAFLLAAAVNARAILASFKPLIKALAALGANRNVKETFDALAQGGEALGEILEAGAEAGPIFAELLVNLTKIFAALADAGAIQVFFSTLNDFAKIFAELLENDVIRGIVNTIGQIIAFGLALQTLKVIAVFAFKVMAGALLPVQSALISTGVLATTTAASIGTAVRAFLGPIGIGIGIFAGVMAGGKALADEAARVKIEGLGAADALLRVGAAADAKGIDLLATAFGEVNGQFEIIKTTEPGEALGNFDAATQNLRFTLQDALADGETFRLLLNAIDGTADDGVNAINDFNDSTRRATEQGLKNIGTTLGTVAQTNLPLAIQKFKELREGLGLTEQEGEDLYKLMGDDFKNAIMNAGTSVGILVTEQEAMNIAMGRGETGAQLLEAGINGVADSATKARDQVRRLKDEIFNFGKVQLDANAAEREFEQALDDLAAALKKNGKTLDITTDAGRDNQAALDGLVRAGLDAANANYELNKSAPELEAALIKLREDTIKGAEAFGKSRKEAEELADQLVGSDYEIKVKVKELTQAEADAAAKNAKDKWDRALKGENVIIPPALTDPSTWKGSGIPWLKPAGKDGGLFSSGVFKRFYMGGQVSGPGGPRSDMIPAMLSNGEFVVNAASTEKYLPLLKALNAEGIGGAKLANGGMAGPTINMTVNAAPGMETSELVNEVSRRIAFELRSGVGR